jgi:hypothetical protein
MIYGECNMSVEIFLGQLANRVAVILSIAVVSVPLVIVTSNARAEATPKHDYYTVVGRYYCLAVSDDSDSGSCDISTSSRQSCPDAEAVQQQDVAHRGDVCAHCVAGQTDNTRKYSGNMDWIQTNTCAGRAAGARLKK